MKKPILLTATIVLSLGLFSPTRAPAIEGLQISIIGNNAILTWPSIPTETYIVQYRPDFLTPWSCLTNSLPANQSGNTTTFTHYNGVTYPGRALGLGGGGGGPPSPSASSINQPLPTSTKPGKNPPKDPTLPPLPPLPPGMIFPSGSSGFATTPTTSSGLVMTANSTTGSTSTTSGFYEVVRVGIDVSGFTNGASLSGTVAYPVEIGWTNAGVNKGDFMGLNATVNDPVNGPIQVGGSALQNNGGNLQWVWNTALSCSSFTPSSQVIQANGPYTITFEADFQDSSVITNQPVTVAVANQISFPTPLSTVFGSQLLVYAQLAVQNATWRVDITDINTNYIGTFPGSTTNGTINFIWDLTDTNGTYYPNSDFLGFFSFTASAPLQPIAQPASVKPASTRSKILSLGASGGNYVSMNHYRQETSFPLNQFLIAWGDLASGGTAAQVNAKVETMLQQDVVDIFANPGSSPYNVVPLGNPGNSYNTSTFEVNDEPGNLGSLLTLEQNMALPNTRLFYFYGHGSPNSIGSWSKAVTLTTDEVATQVLRNNMTPDGAACGHPYRFVFLDGCNTGGGRWPQAFGIPAMALDTVYFGAAGVQARAFIGYTFYKAFDNNEGQTLKDFWNNWLSGSFTVAAMLARAQDTARYPAGAFSQYAVLYGATNLTYNTAP